MRNMQFRIHDLVVIAEIILLLRWWQFYRNPFKELRDKAYFLKKKKMAVWFGRTVANFLIFCPFISFCLGFLGATAPHTLTNSAGPNTILNSLNSSMSPLQTPSPSNPTPSASLWPSSLANTQGCYFDQICNVKLLFQMVTFNIQVCRKLRVARWLSG